MMIISIIVSTMIVMAVVVFGTQYYSLKKEQSKRDKVYAGKALVGGTQEAPIAS